MTSTGPTVAVVLSPDTNIFETAVPCEVFGLDWSEVADPWYRLATCSVDGEPVPLRPGFTAAAQGLEVLATADTVIVPSTTPSWRDAPPPALVAGMRAAYERGARIASICTGGYLLAAAGLLDGRRATTHWENAGDLAERYPAVEVDPDVLYVDDPDGRIYTGAGSAAGLDLCLHLVRLDHGAAAANAVARQLVVPPQRDGGQAQYVSLPVPARAVDGLGPVLDWALAHLAEPITVAGLAARAHQSPRTFARRFRDTTGTTPLQWLLRQRVRRAQELLEGSDEPVESIALRTGFGTAAGMRQHFSRVTRVSPRAYRRAFRSRAELR